MTVDRMSDHFCSYLFFFSLSLKQPMLFSGIQAFMEQHSVVRGIMDWECA